MNRKFVIKSKVTMLDLIKILLCLQMWNTYTKLLGYSNLFRWGMIFCILIQVVFVRGYILNHTNFSRGQKVWIFLLCYFWLGMIYSLNRESTMAYCISITTASIFMFIVFKTKFYEKCFDFLYVILLFSLVTIYLNFFIHNLMIDYLSFLIPQAIKKSLENEVAAGVYSGIFADRANAAFGLNIGFAISYIKYITEKNKEKKYLLLAALFLGGIVITGKRTLALIPVIIVIVSLLIKTQNKKFKRIYMVSIMCCIGAIILFAVFPSSKSFFVRSGSSDFLNSRDSVLWPVAIEMFKGHKILGTGINTYNTILNNNNLADATLSTWTSQAHDIYIQILAETGIVGAFGVIYFIIFNMKRTIHLLKIKINENIQFLLWISLSIQLIWAIYGITGNTFYYSQQLLCYIFSVSMMEAISNEKNRNFNIS